MYKTSFTLLFCLLPFFLFAQETNEDHFNQLDQALENKDIVQAKRLIQQIEASKGLSMHEAYRILAQKIKLSQLENDPLIEMDLMIEYVLKPELEPALNKRKSISLYQAKNDTVAVYLNKSTYSKKLANAFLDGQQYPEALRFLRMHERKYPFPHPCGTGAAGDRVKRQIMFGTIFQHLGQHDSVLYKLLPLTFKHSLGPVEGYNYLENEIDSILLISLNHLYSKTAIIREFEKNMEQIPPEIKRPISRMTYGTEIELFDTTFIIYAVKLFQSAGERSAQVYKIKEQEERDKRRTEIYQNAYIKAFQSNRIYSSIK